MDRKELLENIDINDLRARFIAFCKKYNVLPENDFNVVFYCSNDDEFVLRDFVSPVSSIISIVIHQYDDDEPDYDGCFDRTIEDIMNDY